MTCPECGDPATWHTRNGCGWPWGAPGIARCDCRRTYEQACASE